MAHDGVEDVDVGILPLGGERPPAAALPRDDGCLRAFLEGRQAHNSVVRERLRPRRAIEKHHGGRHGLIGRCAEALRLEPLAARLVVLCDLLEAARHRFLGAVIEGEERARHIVEQSFEMLVKERQPVLLARVAPPGAHGLVERIVAGRAAEQLDVAAPEKRGRRLAEGDLRHRHQHELAHRLRRALRVGVERLDALDRVAEEIEPHGVETPRRKEVEDAAAHRVLAGLHDGPGARIAGMAEALDQPVHVGALAGGQRLDARLEKCARGHLLEHGVDGREHDRGLPAPAEREPRQRRDAPRRDLGVGTDAVVRHRVPGGEGHDAHAGRKELELGFERVEAAVVAHDVEHEPRRLSVPVLGEMREHERVEPFRDTGEGQDGVLLGCRGHASFKKLVAQVWGRTTANFPAPDWTGVLLTRDYRHPYSASWAPGQPLA